MKALFFAFKQQELTSTDKMRRVAVNDCHKLRKSIGKTRTPTDTRFHMMQQDTKMDTCFRISPKECQCFPLFTFSLRSINFPYCQLHASVLFQIPPFYTVHQTSPNTKKDTLNLTLASACVSFLKKLLLP
jgi:hypothetical protein